MNLIIVSALFLGYAAAPPPPQLTVDALEFYPLSPEVVEIGQAGQASVDYTYEISKYEITNHQYAQFLNAVATIEDTHGLYDDRMRINTNVYGSYSVRRVNRNKPVNFVSWFDAVRYVNWLHNDRPEGLQDATTTEAGAYSLTGDIFYYNGERSPDARWALPNHDEYNKAAFYDPATQSTWSYAVQTDGYPSASTATSSGDIEFPADDVANHGSEANWDFSTNGKVTTVGSCQSPSAYGTFDQNGNVAEWTEEVVCIGDEEYCTDSDEVLCFCGRIIRGGSYAAVPPANGDIVGGLDVEPAPAYGLDDGEHASSGQWGFRVVKLD